MSLSPKCSGSLEMQNPIREAFYQKLYSGQDEVWKDQRINHIEKKLDTFIDFMTEALTEVASKKK